MVTSGSKEHFSLQCRLTRLVGKVTSSGRRFLVPTVCPSPLSSTLTHLNHLSSIYKAYHRSKRPNSASEDDQTSLGDSMGAVESVLRGHAVILSVLCSVQRTIYRRVVPPIQIDLTCLTTAATSSSVVLRWSLSVHETVFHLVLRVDDLLRIRRWGVIAAGKGSYERCRGFQMVRGCG